MKTKTASNNWVWLHLTLVAALFCLFWGACSDDDGGNEPTELTLAIEATYPDGAVTTGYRPSIAIYHAEDYSDFSQRPAAMPIAALLGEEGENTLDGFILNLGQTESYIFSPGDYSVVVGVAQATGMPSHVSGTPWYPISVTFVDQGLSLKINSDDDGWRSE